MGSRKIAIKKRMLKNFNVAHAHCPKGGYTHIRHNDIRGSFAKLLNNVCDDVQVEPCLQSLQVGKPSKIELPLSMSTFDKISKLTLSPIHASAENSLI